MTREDIARRGLTRQDVYIKFVTELVRRRRLQTVPNGYYDRAREQYAVIDNEYADLMEYLFITNRTLLHCLVFAGSAYPSHLLTAQLYKENVSALQLDLFRVVALIEQKPGSICLWASDVKGGGSFDKYDRRSLALQQSEDCLNVLWFGVQLYYLWAKGSYFFPHLSGKQIVNNILNTASGKRVAAVNSWLPSALAAHAAYESRGHALIMKGQYKTSVIENVEHLQSSISLHSDVGVTMPFAVGFLQFTGHNGWNLLFNNGFHGEFGYTLDKQLDFFLSCKEGQGVYKYDNPLIEITSSSTRLEVWDLVSQFVSGKQMNDYKGREKKELYLKL